MNLLILFLLTVIRGIVVDPAGLPVNGATVQIKGTPLIAITDEAGAFSFNDAPQGSIVSVSMPGFEPREAAVAETLRIQLEVRHGTEQVSVETTRPPQTVPGTYAISPLDVVRTPGSQADVFRALQVLPGVARVDDGAGLFVRGGDTSEVLVLLDGATMAHPYRYETPTGGFRGAIDPFMTDGLSFSAGGFSARYGNALSAVLDMRGLSRPEATQTAITAGLAEVSGTFATPIGDQVGVRLNAQRVLPKLLFAVNPPPRQFDQYPGGWDVGGSANFDSARLGQFKFASVSQRDHVGVELEKDTFTGFLHSGTRHQLLSTSWKRRISDSWRISGTIGHDGYAEFLTVGVQAIDKNDRHHTGRTDIEGFAGLWTIRIGADADLIRTSIHGVVPKRGGDFAGTFGSIPFKVDDRDWHAGSYVETSRSLGRFTPVVGVRADRFAQQHATTADPRASLVVDLSHKQKLRLAWGIFHQAPSALYLDSIRGAARLSVMSASHYVVGYEAGSPEQTGLLRLESYYKRYRSLPLEHPTLGYTSAGYGSARGVDFFARRAFSRLELRGSASWLDATRRWTPADQQDRYPIPSGTWSPDFSIPLSAQTVANLSVAGPFSIAAAWHIASGRPFTPVAGVKQGQPVYGLINSERLPRYERLDLSASLLFPVRPGGVLVLFASLDNVFAHRNFFEYAYSADYSVRHPVITTSPRSFYFGMSLTR